MVVRGDAQLRRALILVTFVSTGIAMRLAAADSSLGELLNEYRAQPNSALLCERIGVAYTQAGDFLNAAGFFRKAVTLDPKRTPARKNLATVLWFSGEKRESEKLFLSLENEIPNDPVPQLYLGLSAYERKDFPKAAVHLERAGMLASQNPEVLPILAETYLSTRNFEKAREALELELKEDPRSAKLLLELGLCYSLQGDFLNGRQAFVGAIAADPRSPLPLLALGVTDLQTGNVATAAAAFEKAKLTAPNDYRGYYLHAIALKRSQTAGNREPLTEQLEDLKRAAALGPNEASTWAALGEADLTAGHSRDAEADFRRALRLQPDEPAALYKLASLCRKEGKTQESQVLFAALKKSKRKKQNEDAELMSLLNTVDSKQ